MLAKEICYAAMLAALKAYGSHNVGSHEDYCTTSGQRYCDECFRGFRKAFVNDVTPMSKQILNECLRVLDSSNWVHELDSSGLLSYAGRDFDRALKDKRISPREYEASQLNVRMVKTLQDIVSRPQPVFKPVSIMISSTEQFKQLQNDLLKQFED